MVTDDDDDSFRKPGAVPFKWEIEPGVPKPQQQHHHHHHHHHNHLPPPPSPSPSPSRLQPSDFPSPRLSPPPSRSIYLFSPAEQWTRPFQSSPSVRADRWRFERRPHLARSHSMPSSCFFSSLLRRLSSWKEGRKGGG